MLDAALITKDMSEWESLFKAENLVWGLIPTMAQVAADPQMKANGVFAEIEHPELGKVSTVSSPLNVHGVTKDDVRFTRGKARFNDFLEERTRVNGRADAAVLGADEVPFSAAAHGLHEGVSDENAVVEVQSLAVEIARCLADFEEFFNFGVVDVKIDRR